MESLRVQSERFIERMNEADHYGMRDLFAEWMGYPVPHHSTVDIHAAMQKYGAEFDAMLDSQPDEDGWYESSCGRYRLSPKYGLVRHPDDCDLEDEIQRSRMILADDARDGSLPE